MQSVCPVCGSEIRTVPSWDAVSSRIAPLGGLEENGAVNSARVTFEGVQDLAAGRVPENRGLVVAGGDDGLPVGENSASFTELACPSSFRTGSPVWTSQIRAALSQLLVTTRFPSGEKQAEATAPCRLKAIFCRPLAISQRRASIAANGQQAVALRA